MIAFVLLTVLIFITLYTYKKTYKGNACNHNCANCIKACKED